MEINKRRKWRSGCPRSARLSPQVHAPSWGRVGCQDSFYKVKTKTTELFSHLLSLVIDRFVTLGQRTRPGPQRSTYITLSLSLSLHSPLSLSLLPSLICTRKENTELCTKHQARGRREKEQKGNESSLNHQRMNQGLPSSPPPSSLAD